LAEDFEEVVGFDFSAAFIKAAQVMKVSGPQCKKCIFWKYRANISLCVQDKGSAPYKRLVEGTIMEDKVAKVWPQTKKYKNFTKAIITTA
jgi:hypothetical protein